MARILVIDDDRDIAEVVRYIAERQGHHVMQAANGKEGLVRATSDKPELIILDIMMPEMDGYTLNTHLLANPQTAAIPVIVLTAKGQMRDMFSSAINVKFYVDKPFEPSELEEKIKTTLSAKRAV